MKIIPIHIFIFFLSFNLFAQHEWEKWGKAEQDYRLKNDFRTREYNFDSDNPGEFVLKSFANTYWLLVSDVDGDNCPFRPSCSAFFVDAVQETNLLQGSLMFFDRFTRDLNIFKTGKYPVAASGHYHDPASLYILSYGKINISSREIDPE